MCKEGKYLDQLKYSSQFDELHFILIIKTDTQKLTSGLALTMSQIRKLLSVSGGLSYLE